jgi:hypothetical protein
LFVLKKREIYNSRIIAVKESKDSGMQIKRRLFINVAFLARVGLVVGLEILLILERVKRAEEKSKLANEIAISAI